MQARKQWTIDSNLEVVTQEGLDKPLHDFWRVSLTDSHLQKERDVLLIKKKKRKIRNLRTSDERLEERLEATAVGSQNAGFSSFFRDKLLT